MIAYYSRALSKPQRNYCTTRRKLLAVVRAIENFHPYLYGRKFTVRTDHASLQWLLSFKNLEGQLARWLQKLQSYDFCIAYRAGKIHQNADALSRRPCLGTNCVYCQRQKEREFREGDLGSKANDALPVETPNRVVRELQSSSNIPEEGKQEKRAKKPTRRQPMDTTTIAHQSGPPLPILTRHRGILGKMGFPFSQGGRVVSPVGIS